MAMRKGLLIILSGPSGVGKGTVRKVIFRKHLIDAVFSISMTTREKRPHEKEGVDYYFVSREEFEDNLKRGNFLEHAEFVGNCYGTPKDKVEELRNQGKNVFLEIEINGAKQVLEKQIDDRVISFFLMPPSIRALESRIRKRNTESEDIIQLRLKKGINEMEMCDNYDHVVLNEKINKAANEIAKLVKIKLSEK
mgnify:CR=1 FL=1